MNVRKRPHRALKPLLTSAFVLAAPLLAASDTDGTAKAGENACVRLVSSLVDAEIDTFRRSRPRRQPQATHLEDGDRAADDRPRSQPVPAMDAAPEPAPPRMEEKSKAAAGVSTLASKPAQRERRAPRRSSAMGRKDGPSRYTRTNTQEKSVDEGDIVKTDGRYVYHVSCNRTGNQSGCRNELRIFSSWPARRTRLLTRFAIPPRNQTPVVKQIYLYTNKIAVLMGAHSAQGARSPMELAELAPHQRYDTNGRVVRMLVLDGR